MDELLSPRSTFLTPSPPSQFSPVDGYHDQILEFASCEQWLLGEIDVSAKWSAGSSVASASFRGGHASASRLHLAAADEVVEVRMVGRDEAAVRVTTTGGALQAPARLMGALRSLELQVQHACVSRVQSVTVQDVVVEVPAALQLDDGDATIHSALLHRLRGSA